MAQPVSDKPIEATMLFFTQGEYEKLLRMAVEEFERIIAE